ncbi:MAG: SH3 domain-containing protein, partial [Defluviitaleaceae bacterium]|nr:SH3 domain-containing protein [Defluviitaleaceae bacterium]
MRHSKDAIISCVAAVMGVVAIISAVPHLSIRQDTPLRLAENVHAQDVFVPLAHTYMYEEENKPETHGLLPPSLDAFTLQPPTIEGEPQAIYKTTVNLRLRTEPDSEADVVATFTEGTMLLVTDVINEDWRAVDINGVLGYMSAEFLEFVAER